MSHALKVIQQLSESARDLPMLRTTYYTHVPPGDKNSPYAIMEKHIGNCRAIIFTHLEQKYISHEDKDLGNTKLHQNYGIDRLSNYSTTDLCDLVQSSGVEINPKFRTSLENSAALCLQKGPALVGRNSFINCLTEFNYLESVTTYCAKQIPKHKKRA